MLRYGLEMPQQAAAIESAVDAVLDRGLRTPDLAAVVTETPPMSDLPPEVEVGTEEMTEAVISELTY
jgi:isocitrate/isopropylmalate dehydrogenase